MGLLLDWNNELEDFQIPEGWIPMLEVLLQKAGEIEKIAEGEVALSFVGDEAIHQLNKNYRGIDRPTDVLSFAMKEMGDDELEIVYEDEDKDGDGDEVEAEDEDLSGTLPNELPAIPSEMLGDIVISIPRAMAQSADYGHSLEREVGFLFVHGFLHLIGYDHQDDESERHMFAKQELILQEAGLSR